MYKMNAPPRKNPRRNLNKLYTAFFARGIVLMSMEIALRSLCLSIFSSSRYRVIWSSFHLRISQSILFLHIPTKIYTLSLYIITNYINVIDCYSAFKLIIYVRGFVAFECASRCLNQRIYSLIYLFIYFSYTRTMFV